MINFYSDFGQTSWKIVGETGKIDDFSMKFCQITLQFMNEPR